MTRIAALSGASQGVLSDAKIMNGQTRSAHYKAVDFMDPAELEIVDPLSEEPRGLDDVLEIGKLNFG
jgi:hypothetical protein